MLGGHYPLDKSFTLLKGYGSVQHFTQRLGHAFTSGGGCILLFSRCSGRDETTSFLYPKSMFRCGSAKVGRVMDPNVRRFFSQMRACQPHCSLMWACLCLETVISFSLLDLDFMHPFGAQTETISRLCVTGFPLHHVCICDLGFLGTSSCLRCIPASRRILSRGGTPLHVGRVLKLVIHVHMHVTVYICTPLPRRKTKRLPSGGRCQLSCLSLRI